ncbi:hypothetical protein N7513_004760 [Penicillium frequentans]|nr:hypothetical protein N7513_007129 [Penicillium glabrum]KAJ5547490.1 hypothetical protein N7513_004724 [Penicillium glabrum]KAJ5547526.1 hypothetical protein N7513_004760 [Penicillium glabrum]
MSTALSYHSPPLGQKLPQPDALQKYLCTCATDINKIHGRHTPLMLAVQAWDHAAHEILEILLRDCRAKINQKDHRGQTILHLAVIYGDLRAIASLVEQDLIDVDCPDHLGETPLMLAAKLHACDQPNNVKIYKRLLKRSKVKADQRSQGANLFFWMPRRLPVPS